LDGFAAVTTQNTAIIINIIYAIIVAKSATAVM
jgi:hypothetical protein